MFLEVQIGPVDVERDHQQKKTGPKIEILIHETRFTTLPAPSAPNRVESGPDSFFLTNSPFLYKIQIGRTTLVSVLSSNLPNCT